MARKTRSWEKGKYTSKVTDGKGKAVKTGTGSTAKSRSFKKPEAAPKAAPQKTTASKAKKRTVPVGFNVGQGRPTKPGSLPKAKRKPGHMKDTTPKKPNKTGQGRPSVTPKNNAGVRPKQGPKNRTDIKRSALNPLRSSKPLLSVGRARQEVGAMFRGRKKDGTPRR